MLSGKHDHEFINLCPEDCVVLGDDQRLQQVFVNLLSNARDASPEHTKITVEASMNEHTVTLKVIDEGSGISTDQVEQIFEPFFTTKEVGKGTGLGLSLVYSIIEDHYGHISIQSPANEELQNGTCVVISLPRYQYENSTENGQSHD